MAEIIIFLIVGAIVYAVNSKINSPKHPLAKRTDSKRVIRNIKKAEGQFTKNEAFIEAAHIAAKIKSVSSYEKLEERMEKASEKLEEDLSESAYQKADLNHAILQEAYDLASENIIKWYYCPDFNATTKLTVIKNACKPITEKQKQKLIDEQGFEPEHFFGLTINEYIDYEDINECIQADIDFDIETDLENLKALRKIVESKASVTTKVKKINLWVNEHYGSDILDCIMWWTDSELEKTGLTPGDLLLAEQMRVDGLPMSVKFYKQGYTTPESVLGFDSESILSWEGAGKATLKDLVKYQKRVAKAQNESLEKSV